MYATHLSCVFCSKEYPIDVVYKCRKCGGVLDVRYDYEKLRDEVDLSELFSRKEDSLWKYRAFLPVRDSRNIVSLVEGMTPLFRAESLGRVIGLKNLYIKDERRNPTSSFKDRPYSVGVSMAKEFRAKATVAASSGNAAASLAAYSAKAGMDCYIFVHDKVPANRILEIQAYGARVIRVKGYSGGIFEMSLAASEKFGWYNLNTTFYNPYTVEGDKTLGYEIYEQMKFGVPDWIFIPIGTGPLLVGCCKAFKELRDLGLVNALPRMVGVQAEGCAPIAKAFEENKEEVEPWGTPTTIARSVSDTLVGHPEEGTYTLRVIRESKGYAIAVTDEEILEAIDLLAKEESVLAEPASATVIAAAKKMAEDKIIDKDEVVVCPITGTGLKDIEIMSKLREKTPLISADIGELERVIETWMK